MYYEYLPGCDRQGNEEGGNVQLVEGFYPVLRSTRSTHRAHVYIPRADEPVL